MDTRQSISQTITKWRNILIFDLTWYYEIETEKYDKNLTEYETKML